MNSSPYPYPSMSLICVWVVRNFPLLNYNTCSLQIHNILSLFLNLSCSLPLSPSLSLSLPPLSLLSPAGIPLISNGVVFIRQFGLAQVVCDGSEASVLGCTISKIPTRSFAQAQVRCFQQTGTYAYIHT